MSFKKSPFFELRSGSVDTLLFVVKTVDLDALRAELTKRFEATPEFFADDGVAIDLRRLAADQQVPLATLVQILDAGPNASPQALMNNVHDAVVAWQGKEEPMDDQSIVLVQCR